MRTIRFLCTSASVAVTLWGSPVPAATPPSGLVESASSKTIPWNEVGAAAGAQYSGDGLSVIPTEHGARLNCVFQRLEGEATRDGLWLTSAVSDSSRDRFRVKAVSVGHGRHSQDEHPLTATGKVSVTDRTVQFTRPGLVEEYSVSMDGVRQDFVVLEKPGGASVPASQLVSSLAPPVDGELRVELAVTGATVEPIAGGAQLVLERSGRKIAYSRLKVTDADGKELAACIEVTTNSAFRTPHSALAMALLVDDADAVYPVRIDPTFSDANWISMNPIIPGADGEVRAVVVDGSGNLYIGGGFTAVGSVVANSIAKWDGSRWSPLGSGVDGWVSSLAIMGGDVFAGGNFTTAGDNPANYIAKWDGSTWSALGLGINNQVTALAVSGSDIYVGGRFTTAGGSAANAIAKWNGSDWSALGSGIGGYVYALAASGSDLYAGGYFTTAGGIAAKNIARWNGSVWNALGSGLNGGNFFGASVDALAVSGDDLYAGGFFYDRGRCDSHQHCQMERQRVDFAGLRTQRLSLRARHVRRSPLCEWLLHNIRWQHGSVRCTVGWQRVERIGLGHQCACLCADSVRR